MADPIIEVLTRLDRYAGEAGDRDAELYCQVQMELRRERTTAYVVRLRGLTGRWLAVDGNPHNENFGARKIVSEASARKHNNLQYGVERGGRTWHLNEMQHYFDPHEVTDIKEYRP